MTLPHLSRLIVTIDAGVARVVIDNPPVNVLDAALAGELVTLLDVLRDDPTVRVIVFESANPDFFIAHVDMTLIDTPTAFDEVARRLPAAPNPFQALALRLRAQPQLTIVKLEGQARGGGAEFVAAADLSFAALESAGLGQIEALMGILPGGAGTQLLSERTTRGRALEIVLGADLFDAATAERYGWINRALPAADLDGFVDRLARNIAALPEGVIAAAKTALPPLDLDVGLQREHDAWAGLFTRPAAEALIRGGLKDGAQTPDGERTLEALLRRLWERLRPT
ncbi:enoyl-CoA hydratase/isomerase family protein [Brevundimonas sp.]|jgi:enoyl-CoA hydratase/carnithine racemase|uniref:enoyl-CoA hydratase/isomerase family protein n=1 Tax=Brevundimonas sp. TaxID=1871086 RepID=UPI0037C0C545